MKLFYILGVFSLLMMSFGGCFQTSVTLTKEGQTIQFIENPEENSNCIFLEELTAMALTGSEDSYNLAIVKIKNEMAEKKGTHFKLEFFETDELATTVKGRAFRCGVGRGPEKKIESQEKWMIIDENQPK